MATLYHIPLDPFSRRVRLMLAEFSATADLIEEKPWAISDELLALNPAGLVPVLVDDDGTSVCGIEAVSEYLEETRGNDGRTLLGQTPPERAETRRLIAWFDGLFHGEVGQPLLVEKLIRRFVPREEGGGPPDMGRVRAGLARVRPHMDYISALVDERNWLAGEQMTSADLAAAAHLSTLDYLGDVPWAEFPAAKAWYQRIKSRPSFRPLLADRVRGMAPPDAYADLDF